jgi:hypothetical protein
VPLTLANYGLIEVTNVTISVNSSAIYQFDLVTTHIGTLPAHGTVTVPMRVTMLANGVGNSAVAGIAQSKQVRQGSGTAVQAKDVSGPCTPSLGWNYFYQCGPYGVSSGVQIAVNNAETDCGSPQTPSGGTSTTVSGGGGWWGWGGGGTSIIPPSYTVPTVCDCSLLPTFCLGGEGAFNFNGAISKITQALTSWCPDFQVDDVQLKISGTGTICTCCNNNQPSWNAQANGQLSGEIDLGIGPSFTFEQSYLTPPANLTIERFQIQGTVGGKVTLSGTIGATYSRDCSGGVNLCLNGTLNFSASAGPQLSGQLTVISGGITYTGKVDCAIGLAVNGNVTDTYCLASTNQLTLCAQAVANAYLTGTLTESDGNGSATLNVSIGGKKPLGQAGNCGSSLTEFIPKTPQATNTPNAPIVITINPNDVVQPDAMIEAALYTNTTTQVGVCAEVKLQIDQTAVLTENAFHATLQLNNNGSGSLTNVDVTLDVQDQSGQDVTSLFGIQSPTLTGSLTAVDGTGTLAPNASGTAQWTLIPGLDAAPQVATNYLVSGTISYVQNGVAVTIPLTAQSITVQPSPQLYLTYFLQRDVYGDDPFTPEIEPSIPFPLAVIVQNQGYGTAYNFQITSAQPTIVDNEKGLLINFNIIGTEVNGQAVTPSLTANFGDLSPGAVQIGMWWLTSSLDGQFTGYSATFQNIDSMGNLQISPIQSVQIHEITHIVWADGAWDDGKPDFLVIDTNSINSLPNLLYLSDGTIQPVSVIQTGTNSGPVTRSNLQIQFTANFPAGFTYVLIPDPANGQFPLQSVLYANGNSFLTNNFWMTDQTFVGLTQPPLLQTNLHLFVYNTNAGPETYTLVYGSPTNSIQTNPPVSAVFSLPAQSPPTFGVVWSGASYVGGAQIAYYDIYVSEDGGPFTLWQSQTTGTGALYNGTQGHTYAFYSIATDTTGNREATPLQPQAQTTVLANTIPPTISVASNVTLSAGQTLSLNVIASASNPENTLTFTLGSGAPDGVVVNPTSGQITWATSPAFGGTTNLIKIIATDNGQPPLSATNSVQVVLLQVANPPVLAAIANYKIYEAQLLTITNSATDNNLPPKPLTFSLGQGAPTNATIGSISGIFQWRPTAAQAVTLATNKLGRIIQLARSTNVISVVVTDNGIPPLSATQQFRVIVTSVANEYSLALGSTNLLVGAISSVPVTLQSSLPLTNITTIVQVPTALLTNVTLLSVSPEILSTLLQPQGTNQYVISLALNPALNPGTDRTLVQLGFTAVPQSNSAIANLFMPQLSALEADGSTAAKPGASGGRVFIIGRQPLLYAWLGTNASRMLTLYGNPGASYQIACNTNLLLKNWVPVWRVPMTNEYNVFGANQSVPQIFYNAWEFSADPPLIDLNSSTSTNLTLLLYGVNGTNYVIEATTNLSVTNGWFPATNLTLTNSFQFISTGNPTNNVMFFRAKRP